MKFKDRPSSTLLSCIKYNEKLSLSNQQRTLQTYIDYVHHELICIYHMHCVIYTITLHIIQQQSVSVFHDIKTHSEGFFCYNPSLLITSLWGDKGALSCWTADCENACFFLIKASCLLDWLYTRFFQDFIYVLSFFSKWPRHLWVAVPAGFVPSPISVCCLPNW